MLNIRIWLKNPYPFRFSELLDLQEAITLTYGVKAVYYREFPVDFLEVEEVTITTARQIAATLRTIHRQWALMDKRSGGSQVSALEVETEVRGRSDGRPTWAELAERESHE